MKFNTKQALLIVDFGSQFTQLIARRLREIQVYCEIHPYQNITENFVKSFQPMGIILSGGPESVLKENSPKIPTELYALNIPILGICYGQQVMTQQLGGKVNHDNGSAEFGRAMVQPSKKTTNILEGWFANGTEQVWMSHGDHVSAIPKGFEIFGTSPGAPYAIIANTKKNLYGVQFHPEVHHTPNGKKLYENFIKICGFDRNWTMEAFKDQAIKRLKHQIGDNKVICALSGGVDSSVVAVLLQKAIGDQLICIFVDHGLLREREAEEVINMFKKNYAINLIHADEKTLFLNKLKGVSDPEQKRKIIGGLFIDVFEKYSKTIGSVKYLAQGTLYPDVIESVAYSGGASKTIKSHHNVGGLPERMAMKLIEPLRDLFKDEVRELGIELGLPEKFIQRHPFPGPGLAIRCPGTVSKKKLKILRKADAIFIDQIKKYNLYKDIWQAFVVILPVKTVGVMGDNRTYEFACSLRAVTSVDGMTADYYHFSHDFLSETATKIINEVRGINRVTYDITSKPPGTIEWE